MGLFGGLEVVNNKAKFDDASYREVQYEYTSFRAGVNFNF
jgi:hypothetical protein